MFRRSLIRYKDILYIVPDAKIFTITFITHKQTLHT